jgi:hypothetical protein
MSQIGEITGIVLPILLADSLTYGLATINV